MEDVAVNQSSKVLVVDDYLLNLELTTAMLEMMNFNVDSVDDCEEVLHKYRENGYSIILMNLNLSVKSGVELAREIRQLEDSLGRRHIPIIAITGMGMSELDDECLSAGINDCISKPINVKELEILLNKFLNV